MENSSLQTLLNDSYNEALLDIATEYSSQGVFETIFYISVSAVSTPANLIIIICLKNDTGSDTCGFNTYAISVACTDLLVGAVLLPAYTVIHVIPSWHLGNTFCIMVLILDYGLTSVSMLLFLAMGHDRYRSVIAPIRYRCQFKKIRVIRISLVVWCIGFILWIPYILVKKSASGLVMECTSPTLAFKLYYFDIIQVTVAHYIPIIALLVMNAALLCSLNKQRSIDRTGNYKRRNSVSLDNCKLSTGHIPLPSVINTVPSFPSAVQRSIDVDSSVSNEPEAAGSMGTEKKESKTRNRSPESLQVKHSGGGKSKKLGKRNIATCKIVLMIVTFLIFWLPYCITWPLDGICPTCFSEGVSFVFYVLPFGQSAANPLIVIFTSPNIRRKLFPCCWHG